MAKKMTLRQWFEKLDDPDNVGESEYRAVHELIGDIIEDPEVDASHLAVVLDQVISSARAIKMELFSAFPKVQEENDQKVSCPGLNHDELTSVLAALRYWQADDCPLPNGFDNDDATLLDSQAVDALCERINCGGE